MVEATSVQGLLRKNILSDKPENSEGSGKERVGEREGGRERVRVKEKISEKQSRDKVILWLEKCPLCLIISQLFVTLTSSISILAKARLKWLVG